MVCQCVLKIGEEEIFRKTTGIDAAGEINIKRVTVKFLFKTL